MTESKPDYTELFEFIESYAEWADEESTETWMSAMDDGVCEFKKQFPNKYPDVDDFYDVIDEYSEYSANKED